MKLLYLMHVDKKWIKQRPHFLAEKLSTNLEVTVLYARANKRSNLRKDSQLDIPAWPLLQAPLRHIYIMRILNDAMLSVQYLFWILLIRPTHVLIPLPDMYSSIFKLLGIKIIYDCMDDALGFSSEERVNSFRASKERRLCSSTSLLVTSSANLAKKINSRYGIQPDAIIRNAFNGELSILPTQTTNSPRILGYFGTISHWFDFESVLPVLKRLGCILKLAGPCEIALPESPYIEYCGILNHAELQKFAMSADIMIMPFMINDLIRSVDPVKLYEYINFGKAIVSVRYPEVERFGDFCEFYNNTNELELAIRSAIDRRKYTEEQRLTFLASNTWGTRADDFSFWIRKTV